MYYFSAFIWPFLGEFWPRFYYLIVSDSATARCSLSRRWLTVSTPLWRRTENSRRSTACKLSLSSTSPTSNSMYNSQYIQRFWAFLLLNILKNLPNFFNKIFGRFLSNFKKEKNKENVYLSLSLKPLKTCVKGWAF